MRCLRAVTQQISRNTMVVDLGHITATKDVQFPLYGTIYLVVHQSTAAAMVVRSLTRLGRVEMAVGLPEGPS